MVNMGVVNRSIAGINPKLDERMSVRRLSSGPVIRGKEKESEECHAPEQIGPDRQTRIYASSHGSRRRFLKGDEGIAAGST